MESKLLPLDYTVLTLLAPGPAQRWEMEEALERRSTVPLFRRFVKTASRDETRDVLPAFDTAQLPAILDRLERAGLVKEAMPEDVNGISGLPGDRPEERTYAVTGEGRKAFLWWINAIWPVESYEAPVAAADGPA
jgi:hypothetical protein